MDKHGVDAYETLKEWYRRNYCSNWMKLVLQGNLPLDQLEKYAEDYFLQIPSRDQTEQMFLNKRLNKIKQKNIFKFFIFF